MINNTTKIILIFFLVLLPIILLAQEDQSAPENTTTKWTEQKHFKVSISSKLDPITINTMHAWIIHVENNKQQDVLEANITVDGGMPEHDHGLPTHPQITKNLGDGCYLLEGMKFHMGGWWTISIAINDGSISDRVTFDLNL